MARKPAPKAKPKPRAKAKSKAKASPTPRAAPRGGRAASSGPLYPETFEGQVPTVFTEEGRGYMEYRATVGVAEEPPHNVGRAYVPAHGKTQYGPSIRALDAANRAVTIRITRLAVPPPMLWIVQVTYHHEFWETGEPSYTIWSTPHLEGNDARAADVYWRAQSWLAMVTDPKYQNPDYEEVLTIDAVTVICMGNWRLLDTVVLSGLDAKQAEANMLEAYYGGGIFYA